MPATPPRHSRDRTTREQGGSDNDHRKAIARAWINADFKTRLVTRAHDALAEVGVEVPAGTNLRVLENTADTQHIVLPAAPGAADDVSMDDLERVAGGTILTGIYTVC